MENGKTENLFAKNGETGKRPACITDTIWLLVSNHVNLMTMLSAGLVMSPKGYGDNYYVDSLNACPGWIPLFAKAVPKSIIDSSVAEEKFLISCIAEINLSPITGKVAAIYKDGSCRKVELPDGLTGDEEVLLVPAPLPTALLKKITFRSKEDKKECESLADNSSNVPLKEYKRVVNAKFFSKAITLDWPPKESLENLDRPPDMALTIGAMMSLLYQFSNRGNATTSACRILFEAAETGVSTSANGAFIESLGNWINKSESTQYDDIVLSLFWYIADQVAAFRSSTDAGRNSKDIVLSCLESKKHTLEPSMQERMMELVDDLRALAGFTNRTVSELLSRHPKYFSRALILFFLKDKSSELVDFVHPDLNEQDYLAAAILFAARDGWINLTLNHRDYQGMEVAVSHRMAAIAHRFSEAGIDLGPAPPRCVPLRELLKREDKGGKNKRNEVALKLAREYKWDCIKTRISLGKGDYRLVVDGGGAHIFLPGEVKAVTTEVDMLMFMEKLASTTVTSSIENKIRANS